MKAEDRAVSNQFGNGPFDRQKSLKYAQQHQQRLSVQRVWTLVLVLGLVGHVVLMSRTTHVVTWGDDSAVVGQKTIVAGSSSSWKREVIVIEQLPSTLDEVQAKSWRQTSTTTHRTDLKSTDHEPAQPQFTPKESVDNSHSVKGGDTDSFSFCLLLKDDNDILNEWIAYHYHVLKLRQLVVAIDPFSVTSPMSMLNVWRDEFDINVTIWKDADYMPDYFLDGKFDQVPRMIKMSDKNATKWQEQGEDLSVEHLQHDYLRINNHRYRQAKFLQKCCKVLQDEGRTWTTHIDTDEYIVVNPTLRTGESVSSLAEFQTEVPQQLTAGSIHAFLKEAVEQHSEIVNWPCISMPRIFFGSTTDAVERPRDDVCHTFNCSQFETLRWKFHADYDDRSLNKQPKTIMDVSGFPVFNTSRKAFSIHRPSMKLCRSQAQMDIHNFARYPLVVNHYLGSFERYSAREDPRRTVTAYAEKAAVGTGHDNGWIDSWLPDFVKTYGIPKSEKVLQQYMGSSDSTSNESMLIVEGNISLLGHEPDGLQDPVKPRKWGLTLPALEDSTSACLLVKDDNDLLPEWLAYHHHLLKLRTLVIAVDPSSSTSPETILERWRGLIEVTEWTDEDFMPEFFLQEQYHLVPNMLGNATDETSPQQFRLGSEKEKRSINNHRFRQATFFSTCINHLREQNKTWVFHIDTDEYIVLHPQIRHQDHWRNIPLESRPGPSSIFDVLKSGALHYTKGVSYPCISMPRLLFGSREDAKDNPQLPVPFDAKTFESIRWKFHSDPINDTSLNGKPKVILDVSGFPVRSTMMLSGEVFSIHRPALRKCRSQSEVIFSNQVRFPITVNHYIGSWERYNSRVDSRRSRASYDAKALVSTGKDDSWIDAWVSSFVAEHGIEKARLLLPFHIQGFTPDHAMDSPQEENAAEAAPPQIAPPQEPPEFVRTFDPSGKGNFSACLLVKDDNDILNEWIAYHFFVLKLRYMIVAIDGKSTTSPSALLDKWRQFGIIIEEWTDSMFMPESYFNKDYHLQPRLVKLKKNKDKWLEGVTDPLVLQEYRHAIQDHRFRQVTFLSSCIKKLKTEKQSWMIHIDTDEYLVVNPKLRELGHFNHDFTIPEEVSEGLVPKLLNAIVPNHWLSTNYPCISLPRLLYGSIENENEADHGSAIVQNFSLPKFESLRWKYHTAYNDSDLNKQPKVVMDVSVIPSDDKIFEEGRVFSVHRPNQYMCRNQGQMNFSDTDLFPLSVNHYLGTFERFGAREDPRRNKKLYDLKAHVAAGKDDNWLDSWLSGFIEEYGVDSVSTVLGDYMD